MKTSSNDNNNNDTNDNNEHNTNNDDDDHHNDTNNIPTCTSLGSKRSWCQKVCPSSHRGRMKNPGTVGNDSVTMEIARLKKRRRQIEDKLAGLKIVPGAHLVIPVSVKKGHEMELCICK